jgi:hypothetical protein
MFVGKKIKAWQKEETTVHHIRSDIMVNYMNI